MPDVILRLLQLSWNGLPVASLAICVIGGFMYLVMSMSTRSSSTTSTAIAIRRPGWLARRRARAGIRHRRDRVGVGYRSAFGTVHISLAELNHQGYVGGATGSGKTTFLRGLIQGFPGPVIVLDCKGDQDLAETVWDLPGLVWEIGGPLRLDLLDPEPAILAQQLLEGEAFSDRAAVYRAIAEHAIIRAGNVLRWRAEPLEPARILELISSPTTLAEAIRDAMPPGDRMAQRWLAELDEPSATIREGFQTFAERLGSLLDSPVGRSLGSGPEAVRLADVVACTSKLLIRLDPRYGALSRKVGAWTLVAMLRLAAELRQAHWQGRCLFLVDDPRLLQHEGRWLADLFGTARDAGIGLVVADQGIEGLAAVHPDLPNAVLRSTGWQLIFRQGSPADAEKMSALFGTTWRDDVSYASDGRTTTRLRQEPRVYPTWLTSLPTAHAWFHGAPIGLVAEERVGLLVVATPARPEKRARLALPPGPRPVDSTDGETPAAGPPPGPPPTAEELARAAVRRLAGPVRQDGCREWRGSYDKDGYGRAWYHGRKRQAHRLLAMWEYGEFPRSWEVDHTCRHRWCVEITHLEPIPRAEHRRREAARRHEAGGAAPAATDQGGQSETVPSTPEAEPRDLTADERRSEIQRLRQSGWSLRRIAARLGIGYGTAHRALAETGDPAMIHGDPDDPSGSPASSSPAAAPEIASDDVVIRVEVVATTSAAGESHRLADTGCAARTRFAIALFAGIDRPAVEPRTLELDELVDLLTTFDVLDDKRHGRCWSPTSYADCATSRNNGGVEAVSCLVFDCDRVEPDWGRLEAYSYIAHTTYQHTAEHPRWRLVFPLAEPVPAGQWRQTWRRAHAMLCPAADPSCKDPSRQYYLPSHPAGIQPDATCHDGRLLDPATLPELPPEPQRPGLSLLSPSAVPREPTTREQRRSEAYMNGVIGKLGAVAAGGRNNALNGAAWTLGHWVAAGALEQRVVEDALYAAAERNGLVTDDGARRCWATIRSGLAKGLQQPIDLDADDGPAPTRRRR